MWAFTAVLRLAEKGPEAAREPVTDLDFSEIRAEVWFAGCLRRGRPGVAIDEQAIQIAPRFVPGTSRCAGIDVEARHAGGAATRHAFSIRSLGHAAGRAADRLRSRGSLAAEDLYFYEIHARRGSGSGERAGEPGATARKPGTSGGTDVPELNIRPASPPLTWVSVPLREALEGAEPRGPAGDDHPVIYTREALGRAERFARRGGSRNPPVETGAVLAGPLCHCPETGEMFAVVSDVLEVVGAEEARFSMAYTGESWARIQSVMRATRSRPGREAWRILGQCHGHNFLPQAGAPPCDVCYRQPVCARTSVFVSEDDARWSRAVFSGQPWQLCHIFGLNARREPVQALFGQRDGRLLERGFHIVPEFDPASRAEKAGSAFPGRK